MELLSLLGKEIEERIELELRYYPETSLQYAEVEDDILHGSPSPHNGEGRAVGYISNPTQAKAIKLALLADDEQAKWVIVLNKALRGMGEELRMLVQYMYFEQMRYYDVADKLHISVSLVYAWRERVLLEIGIWATQDRLISPMREGK